MEFQCDCLKCKHQWFKRKLKRPDQCPKCKNPDWDKGAKFVNYDFESIAPGTQRTYNKFATAEGQPDTVKNMRFVRAFNSFKYRHPERKYIINWEKPSVYIIQRFT